MGARRLIGLEFETAAAKGSVSGFLLNRLLIRTGKKEKQAENHTNERKGGP
jgi:hypothetical protein